MENSILNSTKHMLGLDPDDTAFDTDVIVCINNALTLVHQMGIGPADGYTIEDAVAVWDDFTSDKRLLSLVKMYVYQSVRIAFDPPTSQYVMEAVQNQIKEYEFRMVVMADGHV